VCRHQGVPELDPLDFDDLLKAKLGIVGINPAYMDRPVNVDFSGGEKKRNEILQMAVLNPRLALLDETDSGLDVDSLKIVAEGVNTLRSPTNAMIVITHYERLLKYIRPDVVHVLESGRILRSGDYSLAEEVEHRGYDWLLEAARA
jgi:Fe-S cluster assembly ATP-binding protein